MNLGIRLKQRRLELGLTQVQVAEGCGLSQATIQNMESGRNRGTRYLVALAKVLDVRPEWLETGEEPMRIGGTHDMLTVLTTPKQRAVLRLLDGLTESQQEGVLSQLETIKRQNEEIYEAMLKNKENRTGTR